ncbi:MAG TPA: dihydropyrimidinase [Gemmatimonadales bacterium]|jgi:dihydropyrimidinase|nr:dihydropyrimidinase [Vicinamibacterales bacterium]HEV8510290.1 dihydropyrimidinase [Gemmatimonadales bacterium]
MALLIRGGRIITATEDYTADIYAEGEKIARIEPQIDSRILAPGTEVIEARGKYVFPGFIDPHVHIYLPFMGTYAADDYESASKAALAGGTTTLIEMICPGPSDEPVAAFELWKSKAEKLAAVDYTFHMSVVRFEDDIRDQFREIVKAGVASFKVFLAYKGALNLSDEHLFAAMKLAKELGVIVTAHCENADAIDALQKALLAAGKSGPEWHGPSRPPVVEADGVHHLCTFAELLGTHVYIVHTSCEPAVRAALAARQRGVNVWIESVIPHFVLDETYAARRAFEGAKYVMSPPLRAQANQAVLWNGVKSRDISTIATDHAPFRFDDQKKMGKDAFTKIPNGIPSIQERVDLVHTCGVSAGRFGLQAMVDACSTQAAQLFGLYPKKGAIQLGSDADLVVYDPAYRGTFSKECSYSNVDYNAYEGWERLGRPVAVSVRGQVQVRNGEFVGTIGRGQFLRREPTH